HSTKPSAPDAISDERPGLPPISNAAIPLDRVEGSTMSQLDLWRIIQSDLELGEGLNALVSTDSPLTPVHGDLRTDQIFYSNNDIWIIDWEDFHLGDPARDLGGILGELLFHQLRQLVNQAADEHGEVTDESIHHAGAMLIDAARPSLQTVWQGYLEQSTLNKSFLTSFRKRVIGYIGWQMFERTMAIGTYLGRITAFERALSGIGRNLILNTDAYSTVLGLDCRENVSKISNSLLKIAEKVTYQPESNSLFFHGEPLDGDNIKSQTKSLALQIYATFHAGVAVTPTNNSDFVNDAALEERILDASPIKWRDSSVTLLESVAQPDGAIVAHQ